MRNFKATIEYDGTEFAGFQWQSGTRTVQGELERAIAERTGQIIRLTGAGRTDAGVHALGQVVSFGVETRIPLDKMAVALNSALPSDIAVRDVQEASADFSARFSASSRVYLYVIHNSSVRSPLWRRFAAHCREPLNAERMNEAAQLLLGERDFASFTNQLVAGEPTMRDLTECRVRRHRELIFIRLEANAFLRGMVRNTVGTLLQVGVGVLKPTDLIDILDARDRRAAGPSAPPQGLCLVRVRYGLWRNYPRNNATAVAEYQAHSQAER